MKKGIENFYNSKWGVFNHYLSRCQNAVGEPANCGVGVTDWNTCVNEFDTELLAKQLHSIGAKFYAITVMQGTADLIAPNETFDKIAEVKKGDCCAKRDLVLDLYNSLSKYNIDLYLYFTGDGPWKDEIIGKRFGFCDPREVGVTEGFVRKWASVLEEYAVRYKDKVKGWWIDGCYKTYFKYTDELVKIYNDAILKGNPEAIVTFNDGVKPELKRNFKYEDFTAGEFVTFDYLPESRFVDGVQTLAFASIAKQRIPGGNDAWGNDGLSITKEKLTEFVKKAGEIGCVVMCDCGVTRKGEIFPEQLEVLKYMNENL